METKALDDALGKLGRHVLFSRKKILNAARDTLRGIDAHIDALENERVGLQRDKEAMAGKIDVLQNDIREKERRLRDFSLINDALGAGSAKNKSIQKFRTLVKNDFREFCDHEAALNDTVPYQQFQHIIAEMQRFSQCPALHSKTMGAIGGGYSSGKSAFINSLIDENADVRLAEGICPVTIIPSYVLCAPQAQIEGINYRGGFFEISKEIYEDISHDFQEQFPFALKEIIPYVIVNVPMPEEHFGHLCFIDTPGYNPPVSLAKNDAETAREYIKDASFLIWLVNADQGTIPQSDLDFLDKLEFGRSEERPLYVVASKPEQKAPCEIEKILDTFEECLKDSDLLYAGISVYSSHRREVRAVRGQNLFDFLSENNKASHKHYEHLNGMLCDIFRPYVEEIYRDDQQMDLYREKIDSLLMDVEVITSDADNPENLLKEGLQDLKKSITHTKSLETRLKRLQDLYDKFFGCLDDFCAEVDMEKTDVQAQKERLFQPCSEKKHPPRTNPRAPSGRPKGDGMINSILNWINDDWGRQST